MLNLKKEKSLSGREASGQFQFLRFLAFMLIFLWHGNTYCSGFSWHTGHMAAEAVCFFVCLSGFLTGRYHKEIISVSFKAVLKYAFGKIKRFYPLYLFATVYMLMFTDIPAGIANFRFEELGKPLAQLVAHVFLLQSWFPEGYFGFSGVGWFLSTMLFLYLLALPVLSFLNQIRSKKGLLLILISGLCAAVIYCFAMRFKNTEFWLYIFPPARMFEYFGAMIFGILIRRTDFSSIKRKKYLCTLLELAALTAVIVSVYAVPPLFIWSGRTLHWLPPVLFLLAVFDIGGGCFSEIFRGRPFVYLGDISFECFLIHRFVLETYHEVSPDYGGISVLGNCFSLCLCLCITLLLSTQVHRKN